VQVLLTVIPFAFLFLGALYAVFSGDLWSAPVSPVHATRADSMAGYVTAASAVYFAYSGWNAVAYVGGEIQDPKRNIPFSLIGGTLVITLLYLLMCAGFVSVLGIEGLRSTAEAGTAVSAALFGDGSRMLMAALIATALIGSLNGCVLAGARVAAAAAADGLAPRWLAKFDPKLGTPVRALVVQFFAASILVLSGRFEDLVTLTSLAMMLLGSLSVIGLFRLLRRPGQDRTGLVLIGFPWLPIAYLAASLIVVVSSLYQSTTNTEAGLSQRLLPMLGLLLFVAAWIGHALLERLRARAAAKG
jgi:APA family basic amino acid/polyamine antiporter